MNKKEKSIAKGSTPVQLIQLGHLAKISSKGGGFCRTFHKNDKIYVFAGAFGKGTFVRVYDKELNYTGVEKILIPSKGRGLGDHDMTFDGEYLYQFPTGPKHPKDTEPRMRGRGVIYKYDTDDFDLVAVGSFKRSKNERITDQNIEVIKGKIYVGSEYRENGPLWRENRSPELSNIPPNPDVARSMHLRIFDQDLKLLDERELIANVKGAESPKQYWGMGASQLYADGYYCVVAQTPIGNKSYFDHGESVGARQIFVIRFDDDFNFVDSKGPLTDPNNDNFWCTGSCYEDDKYYISYTVRRAGEGCVPGPAPPPPRRRGPPGQMGPPPQGQDRPKSMPLDAFNPDAFRGEPSSLGGDQGNIRVDVFDKNFKELATIDLTDFTVKYNVVTPAAHRSSVSKMGDRLYIGYDDPNGSWVRELVLKTAWILP